MRFISATILSFYIVWSVIPVLILSLYQTGITGTRISCKLGDTGGGVGGFRGGQGNEWKLHQKMIEKYFGVELQWNVCALILEIKFFCKKEETFSLYCIGRDREKIRILISIVFCTERVLFSWAARSDSFTVFQICWSGLLHWTFIMVPSCPDLSLPL